MEEPLEGKRKRWAACGATGIAGKVLTELAKPDQTR